MALSGSALTSTSFKAISPAMAVLAGNPSGGHPSVRSTGASLAVVPAAGAGAGLIEVHSFFTVRMIEPESGPLNRHAAVSERQTNCSVPIGTSVAAQDSLRRR